MSTTENTKAEAPLGAIENGRTYIERIEQEGYYCDAGTKIQADTDWQELRRCFETLADWAMHAAPAQQAGAPLSRIEQLAADIVKTSTAEQSMTLVSAFLRECARAPLPLAPSDEQPAIWTSPSMLRGMTEGNLNFSRESKDGLDVELRVVTPCAADQFGRLTPKETP